MNTPYHYAVALAEEMKKEPFAYAYCPQDSHEWKLDFDRPSLFWKLEPLFTHSIKELTDEEIQEVYSKQHEIPPNILAFAKEILRKAQEKWLFDGETGKLKSAEVLK